MTRTFAGQTLVTPLKCFCRLALRGLNEDERGLTTYVDVFQRPALGFSREGQKETIFTTLLSIHHFDICSSGTWHPLVLNISFRPNLEPFLSRTKDIRGKMERSTFSVLSRGVTFVQESANGVLIQTTPPCYALYPRNRWLIPGLDLY